MKNQLMTSKKTQPFKKVKVVKSTLSAVGLLHNKTSCLSDTMLSIGKTSSVGLVISEDNILTMPTSDLIDKRGIRF